MEARLQGHERIDRRSLALHLAIAAKLRANPALLEIARENIERWSLARGRSQPYWDAWREILKRPLEEILQLLEEDSEHMTALRQATPFAGIFDPAERWAIYDRFAQTVLRCHERSWSTLFGHRVRLPMRTTSS